MMADVQHSELALQVIPLVFTDLKYKQKLWLYPVFFYLYF